MRYPQASYTPYTIIKMIGNAGREANALIVSTGGVNYLLHFILNIMYDIKICC